MTSPSLRHVLAASALYGVTVLTLPSLCAADSPAVTLRQITHNSEREFLKEPRWVSADPAHPGLIWRYGKSVTARNLVPPPVFPYIGEGFETASRWTVSLQPIPVRDTEVAGDLGVLPALGAKPGVLLKQVLADGHTHKDETGAIIRDGTVAHTLKVAGNDHPVLDLGPASRPITLTGAPTDKDHAAPGAFDVLDSKSLARQGNDLWLAAVTPAGPDIQVFKSVGGETWTGVKSLGHGDDPSVFTGPNHEIGVLYNDSAEPLFDGKSAYLPAGHLHVTRTADGGKTWSAPEAVPGDRLVARSHASVSPSGHLYAVYETVDAADWMAHTTLWLISSRDAGRTWTAPERITDGEHNDSDPQILALDNRVLIAFTRGASGDVWIATVPV